MVCSWEKLCIAHGVKGRRSQTSRAGDSHRCCQPICLPTTPSSSPCFPQHPPLSPLPSLPFHSSFPFSPFLPLAPPPSRLLCGALIFPSISETLEENERASSRSIRRTLQPGVRKGLNQLLPWHIITPSLPSWGFSHACRSSHPTVGPEHHSGEHIHGCIHAGRKCLGMCWVLGLSAGPGLGAHPRSVPSRVCRVGTSRCCSQARINCSVSS